MTALVALVLIVAVAVAGFVVRQWLIGRLSPLKDHSKKQEDLDADGVEIVVQKPVHERRLKLELPDLSSVQIGSPVGPMKSSIRSALKELRSRHMVQSLCSRFESRLKVSSEAKDRVKDATMKPIAETTQTLQQTRARRRDARDATVAPVVLVSELANETEITTKVRSNNLNKFLRSYASNLDNAISAERRAVMTTDAISAERGVVMCTDVEDDVEQPLFAKIKETPHVEESATPALETFADSDESVELELDLQTLQLEAEYSNQCDSSPTAESEEEVPAMVEATDCEPLIYESLGNSDKGNNNIDTKCIPSAKFSKAFTPSDFIFNDVSKQSDPESTQTGDSKPEICFDPPSKAALARFRQQVPSNGRRALTTLKF